MLSGLSNKIIYHGSYTQVNKPDLSKCRNNKDFGPGFYTTTDRNQAIQFAKRTAKIYGSSYGVLNLYRLSNFSGLSIKEFDKADIEWLKCIIGFRDSNYRKLAYQYKDYDVIIGKIADDNTSATIMAYTSGLFGGVETQQAMNIAIERLMPEKLRNQIVFKTNISLRRIQFMRSEQIWL